jgi:hypothetical protein
MAGVFVNYRFVDGRLAAEVIFRDLAATLGPENVFPDKQAILPGVAYPRKIRTWIHERCSVMVAVIGPGWLSARDENGIRLLDRPRDWVHDEIADALALGLPVLPVPIYDTPLPAAEDLPTDIAYLVSRQAVRVQNFDNEYDVRSLIQCVLALDPGLAEGGAATQRANSPAWVTNVSVFLSRGAAQIYNIAYKPEIAAPLIRLTQALHGSPDTTASVLGHMPARKAAAILEAMGESRAVPILRSMDTYQRGLIMQHLPARIRYSMAADDFTPEEDV